MERVFTDGKASKAFILESIGLARKNIQLAMAYFTDREIATALITAKERGVHVEVILSNDSTNEEIKNRLHGVVQLLIFESVGRGIMHHKFCIVDSEVLLHGSYNYTYNALNNNEESLNATDSVLLVEEYSRIFKNLQSGAENETFALTNSPTGNPIEQSDYLDSFDAELRDHLSNVVDDFDYDQIVEEGRLICERNSGSVAAFLAQLETYLTRVNDRINQDEHIKGRIRGKMEVSLARAQELTDKAFESELTGFTEHLNVKREGRIMNLNMLKERQGVLQEEIDGANTNVSRIKFDIDECIDGVKEVDNEILVRGLQSFPTVLKTVILLLFLVYSSIFFSSALWKLFFEEGELLKLLTIGVTPDSPPLLDSHAIGKFFKYHGNLLGLIACFFFLLPVMLTSVKLYVKNRFIEILIGWIVGIFIVDFVVAVSISQQTARIRNLLSGSVEQWNFGDVLTSGEFWLIFVFGALPMFVTKALIENLADAFSQSDEKFVGNLRSVKRASLNRKRVDLQIELEKEQFNIQRLITTREDVLSAIDSEEKELSELSLREGNVQFDLQAKMNKRAEKLQAIFNDYMARLDAGGRELWRYALKGRLAAFKTGWFIFLNSYFAPAVAESKIAEVERKLTEWEDSNFGN